MSFFPTELPDSKYFAYWGEDPQKLLHPALEYVRRKFGVDVVKPVRVKGRLGAKGLLRVEVRSGEERSDELRRRVYEITSLLPTPSPFLTS